MENFANALQMDVPGVSTMDILMPWAGERADVAAGLSLMLIGSLFGIHARERRMLNSPEQRQKLLELTGFSPEQISRIEQGATVEEKLAKAREELANRNQADISRGAKLYQAELDAANAKHFDPEQTKTLSPVLMMSKQSEVTPADIGRHWMKVAEDSETAVLGETPVEKDFDSILKKLGGSSAEKIKVEEEFLPSGEPSGLVIFRESPREQITLDASNPDEIYINSQYAGKRGTLIYQAIYAWAQNNGKQIVGDPTGLSEIAELRRTSQMFNSALRFGTTSHLLPHPSQKLDGWREGTSIEDFEHNVGLLALREAELVRERLPGLSDLSYADGQFYDGTKAIRSEDRDSHIGSRIRALDRDFAHGAGPTTVARALVTTAAKRSGDRPSGLVGSAAEKASLAKIRYSQAREATETVASPNFSGSKHAEVTDWAGKVLSEWRKDISITIHDSADLIPDENLRNTVLSEGGAVEGFYNPADRSIHILADRMHSEADVQRVLRHEGMHWAFANALQKEYRELLAVARAKIPTEKIDELLAKYPKASDATIVEEYLAYEGQNNPKSTVWRNFVYEAKILLRKVFGDRVEFTDKDILAFLSKANRRLTDQKARDRVNTPGGAAGQSDGLVSFAKAQPGMKLSQVGGDFVVDDVTAKRIPRVGAIEERVRLAAIEFQSWPETTNAVDGAIVTLKVPEQGSIARRVRHLIFDNDIGKISDEKLEWLPNVPDTLENAAVRIVDEVSGNRVYVRAYRGGTKHMVVVRPDGEIDAQRAFTGRLITQFPEGSRNQQSMKIEWIRPGERK